MTGTELKELYVSAAVRARCTPQRTEENEWKKAFEYADMRDLEKALNVYFDNAARSGKGVFMPRTPDLGPLIENSRRHRAVRASQQQELIAFRCPDCKATCSGFFPAGFNEQRHCHRPARQIRQDAGEGEICGGNLDVIHREASTQMAGEAR